MKPWGNVPVGAQNLITQMMEIDPEKRLTAKQCLAHPWLSPTPHVRSASVNDSAVEQKSPRASSSTSKGERQGSSKEKRRFSRLVAHFPRTRLLCFKCYW